MSTTSRPLMVALAIGAAGALALTGCSGNSTSNPSQSATPTQSSSSASPSGSPTSTSNVPKYTVKSGSYVKVAGLSSGPSTANGGTMNISPNGSGLLAGDIEVAAKGTAGKPDWILQLKANGNGNVVSGSLTSPGIMYKVTGSGGKINYLTTTTGTTVVTVTAIPVQQGTDTPTTMTLSITGTK